MTRSVFTEPLERRLRDGIADGSLRKLDPVETATVLFNLVRWTYVHLRTGHRWTPLHAREQAIDIALHGSSVVTLAESSQLARECEVLCWAHRSRSVCLATEPKRTLCALRAVSTLQRSGHALLGMVGSVAYHLTQGRGGLPWASAGVMFAVRRSMCISSISRLSSESSEISRFRACRPAHGFCWRSVAR